MKKIQSIIKNLDLECLVVFAINILSIILYGILIYKTYTHIDPSWENVRYLELYKKVIEISCVIISIFLYVTGSIIVSNVDLYEFEYYGTGEDEYDLCGRILVTSIILNLLIFVSTLFVMPNVFFTPRDVIEKAEINAYKTSEIESVYPDNGCACHAKIQYHVDDGTDSGRTCVYTAKDLGYGNVIMDDEITKPKEKIYPEGITLIIPESYMKK